MEEFEKQDWFIKARDNGKLVIKPTFGPSAFINDY
jgi:hypothetical protein